jgi:hypothetical protein
MRRLLELVACVLLIFNLSGMAVLAQDESCGLASASSPHDGCSPSCLRCACCVQPIDAPPLVPEIVVALVGSAVVAEAIRVPGAIPADILHVPRPL